MHDGEISFLMLLLESGGRREKAEFCCHTHQSEAPGSSDPGACCGSCGGGVGGKEE